VNAASQAGVVNAGTQAGAVNTVTVAGGVGAADPYMVAAAGALAGADRSANSAANQGLRQLQRKRRVGPVVAANEREVLQLDSGVTWELLGQLPDTHVDFLRITYAPGGSSSGAGVLMRHSGTEFGHVLSGQLTLTLGFDTYVLNPGDSVSFDCSTPHSYANHGTEPAMGVWFVAERFR
jgi:quercetin dioxygenase-like cupin family protein